jgi:hypothetical protein
MLQELYNNRLACTLVVLTVISLLFFSPAIWHIIGGITLLYNALGVIAFALESR